MPDSGGSIPQKKKHKTLLRNIKHCYFSLTGNEFIFNQSSVSKWCMCVCQCVWGVGWGGGDANATAACMSAFVTACVYVSVCVCVTPMPVCDG